MSKKTNKRVDKLSKRIKDNFTEVAEAVAEGVRQRLTRDSEAGEGQVIDSTGEVVTLGQEKGPDKSL